MNVSREVEEGEQMVCLTVIPIAYGPYSVRDTTSFTIEPPAEVRPACGFPVFKP